MFKYNRKQFFLTATTLFLVVFLFSGCNKKDAIQTENVSNAEIQQSTEELLKQVEGQQQQINELNSQREKEQEEKEQEENLKNDLRIQEAKKADIIGQCKNKNRECTEGIRQLELHIKSTEDEIKGIKARIKRHKEDEVDSIKVNQKIMEDLEKKLKEYKNELDKLEKEKCNNYDKTCLWRKEPLRDTNALMIVLDMKLDMNGQKIKV